MLRLLVGWTVGLSLLFTATGNGGEDPAAVAGTFAYWLAHIGLGLSVLAGVSRLALAVPAFAGLSVRLQLVLAGLAGAVAFTPVALLLEGMMASVGGPWPSADDGRELLELAAGGVGFAVMGKVAAQEFGSLVIPFVGTWLLINLSFLLANPPRIRRSVEPAGAAAMRGTPEPTVPVPAAPEEAPEGLLGRLKPALGTDVLALKAELNYLHVFTERGQCMVVYSLSRAAEDLGPRGIQVHRSWWVARHAIKQLRRTASGVLCVLANGLEVPVSRRRQKALLDEFGADFRRA